MLPVIASIILSSNTAVAPVDFDTQIVPILTKAGCNSGACHGAAVGRGGFKLSLYGGDPATDFTSIVRSVSGRRVNLARPEQSLLLLKPSENLEHGGGLRLPDDSAAYQEVLNWIRAGTQRDRKRKLERLELQPTKTVSSLHAEIELHAIAHFDDGSREDVTSVTVFKANDPASISIEDDGRVATPIRRGRHIVVARFLDHVQPIEIIVPFSEKAIAVPETARSNFIDDHIVKTLMQLGIPISPVVDDAKFLRRVKLGLTGRLPSVAEIESFANDSKPRKRQRLIDSLLASSEFTDMWTFQFAKLFRVRSQPQDTTGARTYFQWIRRQIDESAPYDHIASSLLTSIGDSHKRGEANFFRAVSGPREQAEFASELFMGVRLRCANCHNHPLDRWTQDDYHGLAAVFAKINRGQIIRVSLRGEVSHPRTGEAAQSKIPGGRFLDPGDVRKEFADWLTADGNPYFSRAIVNRLWKPMMGRGLVEPADDLRATNPATHPELLIELAHDFQKHDFDIRHTLRQIANSSAYQRSSRALEGNRNDDRFYSRYFIQKLEAEVLADAISDVTGVPDRFGDEPLGTRAVNLFDAKIPSTSLDILGRCAREESCESASNGPGGLSKTLHMINGALLNDKLSSPSCKLAKFDFKSESGIDVLNEFYLSSLSRSLSKSEQQFWMMQFEKATTQEETRQLLQDAVWSLLTCREFTTNH